MTNTNNAAKTHEDVEAYEYTNELIHEKSPYLLQHAHNPVNWHAWTDLAFEKARRQDKPVFLSIGYSTCHWCHVMEHDSFENLEVAALLNEHYIAIKVDREERPDIDKVYMDVTHAMTGGGGWPNSIFMTPDKKPFFAGTFFPSDDKYGIKGFKTILREISSAWTHRRGDIDSSAERVVQFLNREQGASSSKDVSVKTMDRAYAMLNQLYDSRHGGIGSQGPKFPQSHQWTFLLHYWRRTGNEQALNMAVQTLDSMARGGMYDQLGGGFHRYSVDEKWLVPHFEKMLYDQALLARTYLESYQAAGNKSHARMAREIFEYVLRDITDPGGAFYSAEDADSEGEEGTFYVWTMEQVRGLLDPGDADLFIEFYGITPAGNFKGANILNIPVPIEEFARRKGIPEQTLAARIASMNAILLNARGDRPRPHRDDKVLTAWNGLMISALAYGAQVLDEPRYARAASRAAAFILETMHPGDRLLRRWRGGQAAVPGFLDDYAFFTNALIDLYEATFDARWLAHAADLCAEMTTLFWDEQHGGFFYSAQDDERHIMTVKEGMDGAEPSGNSVAALALARLARFVSREDYEQMARRTLAAFASTMDQAPHAFTQMLIAADFLIGPCTEIVMAGDPGLESTHSLIRAARAVYNPNRILIHFSANGSRDSLTALVPQVKDKSAIDGKPTAYVCRNYSCQRPVHNAAELAQLLEGS